MTDCVLLDHIAATGRRYLAEHKRPPTTLALGRWDCRELARTLQRLGAVPNARAFLRAAKGGLTTQALGDFTIDIKVDSRIGRMPGAFWWLP